MSDFIERTQMYVSPASLYYARKVEPMGKIWIDPDTVVAVTAHDGYYTYYTTAGKFNVKEPHQL